MSLHRSVFINQEKILFLLIAVYSAGCGLKIQAPYSADQSGGNNAWNASSLSVSNSSGSSSDPALIQAQAGSLLGLKVVSQSEDDVSSDGLDLNDHFEIGDPDLNQVTAEANQISINSNLFLDDPTSKDPEKRKKIYFVWSGSAFGAPLRSAHYTNNVRTQDDKLIQNKNSREIAYDPIRERWFIPLAELLGVLKGYEQMGADFGDRHELLLHLTLATGEKINVTVYFRLTGPLPPVHVVSMPIFATGTPGVFVSNVAKEGWQIRKERIFNPHRRTLSIWVKTPFYRTGMMQLKTYLTKPGSSQAFVSALDLPKNYLMVEDARGRVTDYRLSKRSQYIEVPIGPRQTLTFHWWMKPSVLAPLCTLDPAENWEVMGAEIIGFFGPEIRLAHPYTKQSPFRDAIEFMEINTPTIRYPQGSEPGFASREHRPSHVVIGDLPVKATPFYCQGAFRELYF